MNIFNFSLVYMGYSISYDIDIYNLLSMITIVIFSRYPYNKGTLQ